MTEFNPERICVTCNKPGYWWNDCPDCNNMQAISGFVERVRALPPEEVEQAILKALPPH